MGLWTVRSRRGDFPLERQCAPGGGGRWRAEGPSGELLGAGGYDSLTPAHAVLGGEGQGGFRGHRPGVSAKHPGTPCGGRAAD